MPWDERMFFDRVKHLFQKVKYLRFFSSMKKFYTYLKFLSDVSKPIKSKVMLRTNKTFATNQTKCSHQASYNLTFFNVLIFPHKNFHSLFAFLLRFFLLLSNPNITMSITDLIHRKKNHLQKIVTNQIYAFVRIHILIF